MLSIYEASSLSDVSGLMACMTLAERINEALDGSGLSKAEFARAAKVSSAAVSQWLSGETKGLKLVSAMGLEARTGYRAEWLSEGRLPKKITTKEVSLENNPEYPAIRRVTFKLSAGASGFGVEYAQEESTPIVFQRTWYESRALSPDRLFAVKVANGSMQPGLNDGDTVVVNTQSTIPKDGVVFAVNYEGEMVVKRLMRDEGQWWLCSDNPDQRRYPRKRMHDQCFLLGEIIHKQSETI